MSLPLSEVRRIWARSQGLGLAGDLAAVPGGWSRALGGADPYLALRARVPDLQVSEVNQAIADDRLWVCPGVRGCIWLMPRADVSLSLRVSAAADGRRFERDLARAGSSLDELDALADEILAVLADGPHATDQLRNALPQGSWRSLGSAGKKVGLSTTLPPALRRLEWAGRIRRKLLDSRLYHERYTWQLPDCDPLDLGVSPLDADDQVFELARRFFAWAGPATLDDFTAWSKLGKRVSARAIEALELVEVEVECMGTSWAFGDALELPEDEAVYLLPGLDNLLSLRASISVVADDAHHDIELPGLGSRTKTVGTTSWPQVRPVVHRGRWVGAWEWDAAAEELVVRSFDEPPPGLDAAVAATRAFILDQLDGRCLSNGIDSDKRQGKRAAFLRERA